jgi:predicted O-methyltransferase YrrM
VIYRSNLTAPDLEPFFKYTSRQVKPHSQGHDILYDFADKADDDPVFGPYKQCGFFTHDEAAILYNIAKQVGGSWLDIGGLTGWTAAHMAEAGCAVLSIDPMYKVEKFANRAVQNLCTARLAENVTWVGETSNTFFKRVKIKFDGIVIDGDHTHPRPLQDAINATERIKEGGVIVLHDTIYPGPQKAVYWLTGGGWYSKVYKTPHRLTLCHSANFVPPDHIPDPEVHV